MATTKAVTTNGVMWASGIALTLLIWALQLLGLVDSLKLGCFLLVVAFLLLVLAFWRWESASTVQTSFRALIVVMFTVIYCGLSAVVIMESYKTHYKKREKIPAAPSPASSSPSRAGASGPIPPQSTLNLPPPTGRNNEVKPAATKQSKQTKTAAQGAVAPPAADPQPSPSATQICPNGICIGGDNYGNPQVFNTPQPVTLTDHQTSEIGGGMIAFAGRSVVIMTDGINEETMNMSKNLKGALEKAGLNVKVDPSINLYLRGGRRPPAGISFELSEDEFGAANKLAEILSKSGFIAPGKQFHADSTTQAGTFIIYVGSTTR